jgi:CheY-like chemotaxis protein
MSASLLFVEDDADDVRLTLIGFRRQKFEPEVVVAKNGQEALEILADSSRPLPRAILTDIKMPRMDGLELMRRLKGDPRLREIPVAVLTSSNHEADRREAMRLGAVRYFLKPLELDGYAAIASGLRELTARPAA